MFTTSRYASAETRGLAQKLALERGELFLSRGKRTVAEIAEFARKNGEALVSIVEEDNGKPARICRIKVDELGGWAWSGEEEI